MSEQQRREEPPRALPANGKARNQPCPCGSGKKLKKCCGSGEAHTKRNEWERQQWQKAFEEGAERRRREEQERIQRGEPAKPRLRPVSVAAMLASSALLASGPIDGTKTRRHW